MIKFIAGIVILLFAPNLSAQNKNVCGATYFDSIPLYIQSDLYADRLYHGNEFMTVPERLRISLTQRQSSICGNTIFRFVQKCIDKSKLGAIEYRIIYSNYYLPFAWQTLPFGSLIADVSLKVNEKMKLQFRMRGKSTLIQQTIICRPDWSPLINGYRQRNPNDTFDNKIKSNAAYKTRQLLPGFASLKDSNIVLQPGKQVALQFDSRDLSFDSCIEYRIRNANEIQFAQWQFTGHVLSLKNIRSNNKYVLEVRYGGEQRIKKYYISSLAFWWQKPLAIVFFSMAGIGFMAVSILYFIKQRNRKLLDAEDRLKEQLKTGQSKLNPHFVFNAMSSIGGLVTSDQNDRAHEYLNTFSDIMRSTLKNSDHLFIPLSEELDSLQKYIELELLGNEFRFELTIDPDLDLEAIEFPPMLLQPSIENAVKHGVADLGQNGIINLTLAKQDNDLLITIRDNGKPGNSNHGKTDGGHGVSLTRERIGILGKLFPKDRIIYKLEINENGAIASFRFENWLA